jgi:DNA-binding IclR family transcriptional regulator
MFFKRRGLELLDLMHEHGADWSWSLPELRRRSGWPRTSIIAALVWLEDTGAVTMQRDAERRKVWSLTSEAPEEPAEPQAIDPQLLEIAASLDDGGLVG